MLEGIVLGGLVSLVWVLRRLDWGALLRQPFGNGARHECSICLSVRRLQLVPAVTELMVAELLYLEKQGATLPIEMLINSSGTTRQDGEIVSFNA